jgi:hypothetical protein
MAKLQPLAGQVSAAHPPLAAEHRKAVLAAPSLQILGWFLAANIGSEVARDSGKSYSVRFVASCYPLSSRFLDFFFFIYVLTLFSLVDISCSSLFQPP